MHRLEAIRNFYFMTNHRLFLLDAFALIYRGYFALNASPGFKPTNSKGVDTSAILGFVNTLVELLNKEKPTHLAVVFDTASPTVRHEEYAEYKAGRDEVPDAITIAVPYIFEILKAYNIKALSLDGYEADDLIGTLAKKVEKEDWTTYMVTPDKDFGQLVDDHIFIYRPGKFGKPAELWGPKEVCEKFDVAAPSLVIDFLGLAGDTVDNIPGIPGVGPKTASALLKEFGSVEGILKNTASLKGKLKEKVELHASNAILSKKLATIILDAPVEWNPEEFKVIEPNKEKLLEIFSDLEFRSLSKRVLGKEIQISKPVAAGDQGSLFDEENEGSSVAAIEHYKTVANTPHEYIVASTQEEIAAMVKELSAAKVFCFDTETTSLDQLDAELVGISFSYKKFHGWYIPFPADREKATTMLGWMSSLFTGNHTIIGQNIKYDLAILRNYGVETTANLFDTMLAHYLISPDSRHGMDYLAETYLQYRPVSIETLIGAKGKKQGSMRDVPVEKIAEYAAEDADVTFQLKEIFEPKLKKANLEKLFYEVEMPLVPVLEDMEREGVNLDKSFLNAYGKELEEQLIGIRDSVFKHAGSEFNPDSPRQLGQILFETLKLDPKAKKTKTGQYATGEDILQKLKDKHPIITSILDYRSLTKLKNTYVDALPLMINPKTGRIHTSFMQAVAATGRLSSYNPNLQNIPIRTEKGRETRKAFIPRNSDFIMVSADYSQIELRIIASMSEDKNMMKAFNDGKDIHIATAANVYGVTEDKVTREMRSAAKAVNFGIIYGQTPFGLSQALGIPLAEARDIIDSYFEQFPGISTYIQETMETARNKGYVETIAGRRRYLPDIHSGNNVVRSFAERNAINAPIQGSAADMIKMAMISIHAEIKKRNLVSRMVLQVHDELVFDAPRTELEELTQLVKELMEKAMPLKIPVLAEVGSGSNWLESH